MTRECSRRILNRGNGNASILADYLMAYKRDNPGIAHSSLATNLLNLVRFAEKVIKPFVDMERDDVLGYLDGLEKPESLDPTRKWKGFYNAFSNGSTIKILMLIIPKPAIVAGLKKAKPKGGKKRKMYGPGDM